MDGVAHVDDIVGDAQLLKGPDRACSSGARRAVVDSDGHDGRPQRSLGGANLISCYGTRSPLRRIDPYHRFRFSVPDGAWNS